MKLATYYAQTHEERTRIRRRIFDPACEAQLTAGEQELRAALVAENEATGWFPTRWVDSDAIEDSAE